MSFNTFGKIFRFTTWGESHGPAIGCVVDGCPPNINIKEQESLIWSALGSLVSRALKKQVHLSIIASK